MAAFSVATSFMAGQINWPRHVAEALKYSSRAEFARGSKGSYSMLWKHGRLDDACAHMRISPIYSTVRWSPATAFAEAGRHHSRSAFKRECSGAYMFLLANGLLEPACIHMRDGVWTTFELMAVAAKCQSLHELRTDYKNAYSFATKHRLTRALVARMEARRIWNKDDVLDAARTCTARGIFHSLHPGAYKHAIEHGYLEDACAHMAPMDRGFAGHREAFLYHLQLSFPCGTVLYKVGITHQEPKQRAIGMGAPRGTKVCVLHVRKFTRGRDARLAEGKLHAQLSCHRYAGPRLMKNGNTELFTAPATDLFPTS